MVVGYKNEVLSGEHMKLQYRIVEYCGFQWLIKLYHDGKFIKSDKVYVDELDEETNKLVEQGYEYGFTKEEIQEAKERYESMLKHIIG
jgi:hypothetical protein